MSYSLVALPWDLAILLLLSGGGYFAYRGWKKKQMWLSTLSSLFFLVIFYGSFIEPQVITVTERDVSLPMKEDMTIVVLSDFHVGLYKGRRFVQRIVDRVNTLNPDLILLAGDFVFAGRDPLRHFIPLRDLHPRYGVFAVLGDHEYICHSSSPFYAFFGGPSGDHSLHVRRALERNGVVVLRNEWRELTIDTGLLFVGGVDDSCSRRDDIVAAIPEVLKQSPLILVSHSPDIILEGRAKRPNLIVAGHTHGGQIRLPFIGPIAPSPTQLGWQYDQGLFPVDDNTTLAITRGAGESGVRARLFAPPEILLLHARGIATTQ
jgi:predicted MPP superfamily phosphohydrolase